MRTAAALRCSGKSIIDIWRLPGIVELSDGGAYNPGTKNSHYAVAHCRTDWQSVLQRAGSSFVPG